MHKEDWLNADVITDEFIQRRASPLRVSNRPIYWILVISVIHLSHTNPPQKNIDIFNGAESILNA